MVLKVPCMVGKFLHGCRGLSPGEDCRVQAGVPALSISNSNSGFSCEQSREWILGFTDPEFRQKAKGKVVPQFSFFVFNFVISDCVKDSGENSCCRGVCFFFY